MKSFDEFYLYYLEQHKNFYNRVMHFIAGCIFLSFTPFCILNGYFLRIPLVILVSYAFAWTGHYVFEKNKPATFGHPLYSIRGEFRMFFELLSSKRPFREK